MCLLGPERAFVTTSEESITSERIDIIRRSIWYEKKNNDIMKYTFSKHIQKQDQTLSSRLSSSSHNIKRPKFTSCYSHQLVKVRGDVNIITSNQFSYHVGTTWHIIIKNSRHHHQMLLKIPKFASSYSNQLDHLVHSVKVGEWSETVKWINLLERRRDFQFQS